MEGGGVHQESAPPKYPHYSGFPGSAFPMTLPPAVGAKPIRPMPILPVAPSSKMANLNLKEKAHMIDPLPLSLKLPTPSKEPSPSSSSSSAFEVMSGKLSGGGDSMISVA